MTIAIIKAGGKQYKVKEGQELKIEKIAAETGEKINLDVLLVADENGENVQVGTPVLTNAVEAEVLEQGRGKKITIIKFKAKTRYRRKMGHRQPYSKVKVTSIK